MPSALLISAALAAIIVLPSSGFGQRASIGLGQARVPTDAPVSATGRTSGACPGYVKDHVLPLACGGPDAVSNLQWQTIRAAKAKDKWETKGCTR
jgi:hypothetical protein